MKMALPRPFLAAWLLVLCPWTWSTGRQVHARSLSDVAHVQEWAETSRGWFLSAMKSAEMSGSSKDAEELAAAFGLPSAQIAREITRLSRTSIRVYAAVAQRDETLSVSLPDGAMSRAGTQHGIVVLDPYPAARFGHPILMFFVNRNISERRCLALGGKRLDNGACLQVARKNRCPNMLAAERAGNNRVARHRGHPQIRCAINFLPLVRTSTSFSGHWSQRLICRNDLEGFSDSCPVLRNVNATSHVECDPLRLNTHRCDTTHAAVRTRCRLFQTCDQAVLLSGGWNRQLSDAQSLINMLDFYDMLRRNGFHEDNIKVFFANGLSREEGRPAMFPAVMKLSLRYHLRAICESPHCADSLVVYLNSPARSDGSPLLWDLDNNGEADETEVYTVRELLRDIQWCVARRVLLIADQSYSGELVRALHAHATSSNNALSNVMVFASGSSTQPAWQGDFTAHWARAAHGHTCLHDVHEQSLSEVLRSSPNLLDTTSGDATRTTLTGAPCGLHHSLPEQERRTQYEGCQNVPTRIWLLGNNDAKRRRR